MKTDETSPTQNNTPHEEMNHTPTVVGVWFYSRYVMYP
jgi:hypothetical protein